MQGKTLINMHGFMILLQDLSSRGFILRTAIELPSIYNVNTMASKLYVYYRSASSAESSSLGFNLSNCIFFSCGFPERQEVC